MKSIGTLRELIVQCNLAEVYVLLFNKHKLLKTEHSLNDYIDVYKNVIIQLMLKPIKKTSMPFHVSRESYLFGESDMTYHVCFLNPKYKKPLKGTKPWCGRNPPNGYFNANLNKYNKYFAVIENDWTKLINADVVVANSARESSIEVVVAEILWQITFSGFSEKKVTQFIKNLKKIN